MIKNKISIIAAAVLILFSTSCTKDWLDVNEDPNNAQSATAELVFPAGVVSVAGQTGGYYNLIGGFWSQYWSQSNAANQYKYLDQYQIQSGDFNGNWREMYANGLSDLQFVIDDAKATKNTSYELMGTVMQAYGFAFMVDFYNDIPYSEAFQGDSETQNFSPKFEKGKDIYADLIKRIDAAAAAEMTELTDAQVAADFVFNGNMDQWKRFANTLKLRMYIRMAYADEATAKAGVQKMYADGDEFLSSDAGLDIFVDAEGQDNPLYASDRRKLNVKTNLRVSSTIYRYYEEKGDGRINAILGTSGVPMPQGGFNIPSTKLDPPSVALFAMSATDAVYFISYVESLLLQAEAIERGWGTGDAKALYDAAVEADFARKGISGAGRLLAQGGVYEYPSAGSFDAKLEAIIMAKWAAFAGSQNAEAFFETNRTGYPKYNSAPAWDGSAEVVHVGELSYSIEGVTGGVFPARMIYPQDEVNLNTSFPGQTKTTDKVWWDKN